MLFSPYTLNTLILVPTLFTYLVAAPSFKHLLKTHLSLVQSLLYFIFKISLLHFNQESLLHQQSEDILFYAFPFSFAYFLLSQHKWTYCRKSGKVLSTVKTSCFFTFSPPTHAFPHPRETISRMIWCPSRMCNS